jgi:GGDEF domain-containing protein
MMNQTRRLIEALFKELHPNYSRKLENPNEPESSFVDDLPAVQREWVDKSQDPVTGLLVRGSWYDLLSQHVSRSVPNLPSDEEGIRCLPKKALGVAKKHEIFVIVGDVAYLGLANKQTHHGGDQLLRSIGEATDAISGDGATFFGRCGGDELYGASIGLRFSEVAQKVASWQEAVRNLQIDSLHGLAPEINVGIASLTETLSYIIRTKPVGNGRTSLRDLVDLMVRIADHRATYEKCVERIELLSDLWSERRETYWVLSGFLIKGASNPTEEDIKRFAALRDGRSFKRAASEWASVGADDDPVKQYALRKLRRALET